MDLGTVKKKLEAREYTSVNEFAEDMRLIFHNCYQYNPSDNPIHQMAQKLHVGSSTYNCILPKYQNVCSKGICPKEKDSRFLCN